MYRDLDIAKIATTAELIERRIGERFPDSGLSGVAAELSEILAETEERGQWIRKPKWWLRAGVGAVILLIVITLWGAFRSLAPLEWDRGESVDRTPYRLLDGALIGKGVELSHSHTARIGGEGGQRRAVLGLARLDDAAHRHVVAARSSPPCRLGRMSRCSLSHTRQSRVARAISTSRAAAAEPTVSATA